jgi:DNA-binding transcriptional ArsR family regulator
MSKLLCIIQIRRRNQPVAKRKGKRKASTITTHGGPMDGVLAKALAHSLRAEILAFLTQQAIASPAEMLRAGLGQKGKTRLTSSGKKRKLPNISYHVKVLRELELIRLVYTRPVRGSVEHFYEASARMLLDLDEWSKLPDAAKNDVSIAAVEETIGLASEAISAGTFDSFNERTVANLGLRLDEEAYKQLAEEMADFALRRCEQQLQGDALQRAKGDLSKLMHVSVSMLLYESPPPKRP